MTDTRSFILDFFNKLNDSGIRYVLLRNIGNELPDNYQKGKKDIDLLVHPNDRSKLHSFMKKNKLVSWPHPLDKGSGLEYLYAVYPFEFYKKDGYYFDICYQMVCKSPNAGEYMPVDMLINTSVWENRRLDGEYPWYRLSDEDLMVHLLTRCIFDKKKFTTEYKNELIKLNQTSDKVKLKLKLETVFFKYSDTLLKKIETGQYDNIINSYLSFIEY